MAAPSTSRAVGRMARGYASAAGPSAAVYRTDVLSCGCTAGPERRLPRSLVLPYAELHCHSCFSFLDGASSADDLVARARELDLSALALTDHQGLYGAVRFVTAAEEAGLRPIIGLEVELLDAAVPDPAGLVIPARRRPARRAAAPDAPTPEAGHPVPPRTTRLRVPGHRAPRREDLRGIRDGERGPHLVLLARDATGYRSLCRLASAAHLAGTKGVPRFTQALLARHTEGLVALSGCRHSEIARRLLAGDRAGALEVARRYAALYPAVPGLGGRRVLPGGPAPPAARRRPAGEPDRGPGRRRRPAPRRHQRRALRAPGGPRAAGRAGGHPARPDAGDERPPAA